jgi:hypothetical protein
MRFKLISCEVIYREMCDAIAHSEHQVDVEFLTKGLHEHGGCAMSKELQRHLDSVDTSQYDAILLGYGLCGSGAVGLRARSIPLVIPRVHDCIGLLMGSRYKYQQFISENQGVYFRSTGWLERGQGVTQITTSSSNSQSLGELVAKYGDENGRYLFDELNRCDRAYKQLTFIETGLEPSESFEHRARKEAESRGWKFSKVDGNLGLFRQLVSGSWSERDFLVVPPGCRVIARYDEDALAFEKYT